MIQINTNAICVLCTTLQKTLPKNERSLEKLMSNQRVKKREGKTQIFGFWAGQSGQIFLAGYIWAVKSSHRWQHLWAKVEI